ncbi:MAG: excinuclease ABC subunit UvrA [Vicinamibacterales bacterium]|nr:excinuclease ABC subunit UvrA [Vicinamibacterales bacterium]
MAADSPSFPPAVIAVRGASEHNLHHADVDIPRGTLAVVTGVSGSGKSSLAFDTICAEGRRRYLETFSSYARQFFGRVSRPAVGSITGLSPAVALDQSTVVRNPRSTVGTMTELHDLLRLLWARFGDVPPGPPPVTLARQLFSFNSPYGACPSCKGLGVEDRLDPQLLVADPRRTVRDGALRITTPTGYVIYSQVTIDVLDQVCRAHGFSVDIPWQDLSPEQRHIVLNGSDRIRIPYGKHPLESRLRWKGITAKPREEGVYKGILPVMEQILRQKRNANILRFVRTMACRACGGSRLRPEALVVTFRGRTIADAARMTVSGLRAFIAEVSDSRLDRVRTHVLERCDVLMQLGIGYLTLDRGSTTVSGGEAQRLRLARHATVGLGGLLYVLDEPSVGLHPHDTSRLLAVLRTIRDRGNTVIVVDHDEDTMRCADWIVDVGPGAGATGGRVLFSGPPGEFVSPTPDAGRAWPLDRSRTRAFLCGRERIAVPAARRPGTGTLRVSGLTAHNLVDLDAAFLLGALNVVSGVSGAGKSTLLTETIRLITEQATTLRGVVPATQPSSSTSHGRVIASTPIGKVISIDQAPIGRTPRSNPATYTGVFDAIRDAFAAEPEALRLGFGKGRFSFNVAGGRCDTCEGAGVQQFGMQFLGAVSVPCESCGGQRFNEATLAIRHQGLSIHDVLALSIADAYVFFDAHAGIARVLRALNDLGLGYLPLGHPATMMSGGEAQRVKLATELARSAADQTLYVLDEPTTGLHRADVARLLTALDALVARGHTVVTIEHQLDIIAAADRLIDLGPGSGLDGGRVVVSGTPEEVAAHPASLTAGPLRAHLAGRPVALVAAPGPPAAPAAITFTGVSTHNLRRVDVSIPRNRLTVVTGVSGSGKSSLAFDTVFAEGQQRYLECLSAYARRFVRQGGDAVFEDARGLTATVAIRQQAPSRNPRSTVATLTDIHDAYRVLYSRAGTRTCPACAVPLDGHSCPSCGFAAAPILTAAMFSPNSEAGACPACHGLGYTMDCDADVLITDRRLPLAGGAMNGHKAGRFYGDPRGQHMATLGAAASALGLDVLPPWQALSAEARHLALRGAGDRTFEVAWSYERGNRRGVHWFTAPWPGLLALVRQEFERKHDDRRGDALAHLMMPVACDACRGAGLMPAARAVVFAGEPIHTLLGRTVDESLAFFGAVESGTVPARTLAITANLRMDLVRRLTRLQDAGLGYLALDRQATTLSGGEAQRVRLAAHLQAGLTGITYVLDEPTAGLHARDTARLIGLLRELRDGGNTVIVVEHDLEVVAAADHVIELGPGAGSDGGLVVAEGVPASLTTQPASRTGLHLAARRAAGERPQRTLSPGIDVRGARIHNLDGLNVDVPAAGLVAVTGVSGSGKSSLIFDVIAPSVARHLGTGGEHAAPVHAATVTLRAPFTAIVNVGATATGVAPWSSPATQTGMFDAVRDLFASTEAARTQGLKKAHFSTTSPGGRCETCEGRGHVRIGMDFLPDVWVSCEDCGGRGYGPEVLACTVDGRSIADVLAMRPTGARAYFGGLDLPARARQVITRGVEALERVGLGYVSLGQPTNTLSGGERQRLVLAAALAGRVAAPALYLLDEPTTGLHSDDVRHLIGVLDGLVADGHTVIVVEHHLDVIAAADWVIDLGPEGGAGGGRVVAEGPPATIASCDASWTGRALRERPGPTLG